jgi:hypothetical protein
VRHGISMTVRSSDNGSLHRSQLLANQVTIHIILLAYKGLFVKSV